LAVLQGCYVLYSSECLFFFFFQAEDGIRDFHVTGVQTCALPISEWLPAAATKTSSGPIMTPTIYLSFLLSMMMESSSRLTWFQRSEERRVGKECRPWWSQDS